MPSVRYINQSAPFWDFVANMEETIPQHPLFNPQEGETAGDNERPAWGAWPFGPFAHRGRHGPHPPRGPPPPAADGEDPNAPQQPPPEYKEGEDDAQPGPSEPRGPRHGCPGADRRGPGPHRGHFGRRGGCHPRGRGPYGARGAGPFLNPWMQMFQEQFGEGEAKDKNEDFKPEVDVFDTAESFVVHVSLAGAKKEDVGVNWDAEKSELSIAGVIYRPGDEELLKTLALDERSVGAFERKVRLGSRASPAQVDVDGITAKMEDGVLTIEVPKLDSGYVEVKKVDIE